MWRFDYDTLSWTQLDNNVEDVLVKGRSGAITPWGVIAVGGLNVGSPEWKYEGRVWQYDTTKRSWNVLDMANEVDAVDGQNVEAMKWRSR